MEGDQGGCHARTVLQIRDPPQNLNRLGIVLLEVRFPERFPGLSTRVNVSMAVLAEIELDCVMSHA